MPDDMPGPHEPILAAPQGVAVSRTPLRLDVQHVTVDADVDGFVRRYVQVVLAEFRNEGNPIKSHVEVTNEAAIEPIEPFGLLAYIS